jgi:hypothetical protein
MLTFVFVAFRVYLTKYQWEAGRRFLENHWISQYSQVLSRPYIHTHIYTHIYTQTQIHSHCTRKLTYSMPFKVKGIFIQLMLASLDTRHINKSC